MVCAIARTPYGIRVTFVGMMDEQTAREFSSQFLEVLATVDGNLSILIDLRKGSPISVESQQIVNECYHAVIRKGLVRSANIVTSTLMKLQMVRRAKELGTYDKVRYIDATVHADCERIALDWLEHGVDPDQPEDGASEVSPVRSAG